MTREEAIKWYADEIQRLKAAPIVNGCEMQQEWAEQIEIHSMAIEALRGQDQFREATKMIGWISVEDRLPEPFVSVLIYVPSEAPLPMVKEAYLANGWWATKMAIFSSKAVTHWMPLPEPPVRSFNCEHNDHGFCRKYSTLEVAYPCKGDGDCEVDT